jgi:hypothetical protein
MKIKNAAISHTGDSGIFCIYNIVNESVHHLWCITGLQNVSCIQNDG